MTPDIVVDIGNTRIKWGLCDRCGIAQTARLPAEPAAWDHCLAQWRGATAVRLAGTTVRWAIAGVVPGLREQFRNWAVHNGGQCLVVESFRQVPLEMQVDEPGRVGIDRLLDALAAWRRSPGTAAILVDTGSAVTVDWLDERGTFHGGTIFPGFRLMANALRHHTAQLPIVEMPAEIQAPPGRNTEAAMTTGIAWAIAGGILQIARHYVRRATSSPVMYLTGGDASTFLPLLVGDAALPVPIHWPEQTLLGIRWAAEAAE